MSAIIRPSKVYDFTAFARRQPTSPPPGDRLDAQLQNHADAITAVQLAVESLKTVPDIDVKALAAEIKAYAAAEFGDLRQQALNASAAVSEAKGEAARARADADYARAVADRAEAQLAAAVQLAATPQAQAPAPSPTQTLPTPTLYPFAGGPYAGDEPGATATAADYAQVAIDWAEFMDGNSTIPPNTLAINMISGDHWSSRWWANRSATAFGMLAWWYQGAWPGMPPTTPNTPTGQPIPVGAMFFNTTTNTMMVWNGSTWVNASSPQKGVSASLYYAATNGQKVFPLSVVDRHGKNFAFNQTIPEGVEVYIDGAGRLEPTYDFTIDYPSSTLTLVAPALAGAIVTIDVMVPASALAPSGSANTLLINPITPDGTTTAFTGLTIAATGAPVAASKSEELYVSVDGVIQQPGTAYSAVGANITFLEAPTADAKVFMVWFGPPVIAGGGGGGGAVSSVAGRTGDVVLSHADITDWNATLGPYALLASPLFTGDPRVPTAAPGDADTTIASTAFVANAVAAGGGGGISDAPNDGQYYLRHNLAWAASPPTLVDAPSDSTLYARKSAAWSHVTHNDITDWAAALAPYGLAANIPGASSSTPAMDGVAAIGVGTTWARADHIHPTDTTRLSTAGGTVQGPLDLKVQNVTAAASTAINRALGENVALALGVNITAITVSGWPAAGFTGKVRLVIASSGAFTISGWPAGTIWPGGAAPTITSGSGKRDIILLMSDDGGTTVYGSVVGQDYR